LGRRGRFLRHVSSMSLGNAKSFSEIYRRTAEHVN
jgi:hypothetical protein